MWTTKADDRISPLKEFFNPGSVYTLGRYLLDWNAAPARRAGEQVEACRGATS